MPPRQSGQRSAPPSPGDGAVWRSPEAGHAGLNAACSSRSRGLTHPRRAHSLPVPPDGGWRSGASSFFAKAIDRSPPAAPYSRDLLPGAVRAGHRLKRRVRHQCELTREATITDGIGRHDDFAPERFETDGPVTGLPEAGITGPVVPVDAAPGRGPLPTVAAWTATRSTGRWRGPSCRFHPEWSSISCHGIRDGPAPP